MKEQDIFWLGRKVSQMSEEELRKAFKQLFALYQHEQKEADKESSHHHSVTQHLLKQLKKL